MTEFITVEFGPPARGCPGGPITCGCGAGGPGNEHVLPRNSILIFSIFQASNNKERCSERKSLTPWGSLTQRAVDRATSVTSGNKELSKFLPDKLRQLSYLAMWMRAGSRRPYQGHWPEVILKTSPSGLAPSSYSASLSSSE